jgi:HemY protein
MKWLITLLLALGCAIAFTVMALKDPGFVVIGWSHWTIEMSLTLFIILLIFFGLISYSILRFLTSIWQFPQNLLQSRTTQRQQKAKESLVEGFLALLQGQWQTSEHILAKTAPYSELPVLHYFGAAYASYHLQQTAQALNYLAEAQEKLPLEYLTTTLLFQAKLQQRLQNIPAALRTTLQAYNLSPKQPEVLSLLATLYLQLADWSALLSLLPEIRKYKALSPDLVEHLEEKTYHALIQYTLRQNPAQTATVWETIPKAIRLKPAILHLFVQHLARVGDATTAEPLLREALKYHWDKKLLFLYGTLETTTITQQIHHAESWLKTHSNDATLFFTLGHLCVRSQSLEKAKRYLEISFQLEPNPMVCKILGDLLTQTNELAKANEYYQQGLHLTLANFQVYT